MSVARDASVRTGCIDGDSVDVLSGATTRRKELLFRNAMTPEAVGAALSWLSCIDRRPDVDRTEKPGHRKRFSPTTPPEEGDTRSHVPGRDEDGQPGESRLTYLRDPIARAHRTVWPSRGLCRDEAGHVSRETELLLGNRRNS